MQVPQQIDMDVSVFLRGSGAVQVAGGKGAVAKKVAGMCTKCCKKRVKKAAKRFKTKQKSKTSNDDDDDPEELVSDDGGGLCTVS